MCSAVVKGVHDFVRELLSSVVASVIVWAGELAATALLATPIVLEQLAVRVAALSVRAARMITGLMDAVERFIALLRKMATVYSSLTRVLRSVMSGGVKVAPPIKAVTTKHLWSQGAAKVPTDWGFGTANSKLNGVRWTDPDDPGNGIRIDIAEPSSPWPSQQVEHVVVRSGGNVLGPDGQPVVGAIKQNPQAHIPLEDWINWKDWNRP
jgi:hypothetical protein